MRFSLALVKRIHTHYISISLSFPLSYVAFHLSFRRQNSFYIVNYIVKIACRRFSTGKKNENSIFYSLSELRIEGFEFLFHSTWEEGFPSERRGGGNSWEILVLLFAIFLVKKYPSELFALSKFKRFLRFLDT